MKQILQNLKTGATETIDVPAPAAGQGQVLIRSSRSLISAGTERMLVEFGHANLLQKARSQPDKVKQVLDKIRTDGLFPTMEAVFKRLDEPLPLGYCNVGRVIAVGEGITEFAVGDRVASNGPHAEIVVVPKHLCAKIPDSVTGEEAAFSVLGAIALQGIRLVKPELGEKIVVFGAGLIGLITTQLLKACGCCVLAVDVNENRLNIAKEYGAQICPANSSDPIKAAASWTKGHGVDAVLITASAETDIIIHQAAQMSRKRGRIILVGVVGLNFQRADFYEKELKFQVSCSYGPGRHDHQYEQKGRDYPLGYVRWTEKRNIEAVLGALALRQLCVESLITRRFPFEEAAKAYERIISDPGTLGVILEYPDQPEMKRSITVTASSTTLPGKCVAAMVGAGNFAKMTLAPALVKTPARLKYVSALTKGETAVHLAKKYGFEKATTDLTEIFEDPEVNTIFITTNHDSHASLFCKALVAGKHVLMEKPLALDLSGLNQVIETAKAHLDRQVMVGFNRRFSPHIRKMRDLLTGRSEPLAMSMTINAGIIPPEVWVHDPERGGGRIIGEACHSIDLMVYLAGCRVLSLAAIQMGGQLPIREDKMSILLSFEDGSVGTLNYFGNGNKAYPKETLEVYSEGRILKLDNFRSVAGYGFRGFRKYRTWQMDKGHQTEVSAFVDLVEKGGKPLIPFSEIVNVTLASFAAITSAREGRQIDLEKEYGDLCI